MLVASALTLRAAFDSRDRIEDGLDRSNYDSYRRNLLAGELIGLGGLALVSAGVTLVLIGAREDSLRVSATPGQLSIAGTF
jgi:hypothetical protein